MRLSSPCKSSPVEMPSSAVHVTSIPLYQMILRSHTCSFSQPESKPLIFHRFPYENALPSLDSKARSLALFGGCSSYPPFPTLAPFSQDAVPSLPKNRAVMAFATPPPFPSVPYNVCYYPYRIILFSLLGTCTHAIVLCCSPFFFLRTRMSPLLRLSRSDPCFGNPPWRDSSQCYSVQSVRLQLYISAIWVPDSFLSCDSRAASPFSP